MLRRSKMIFVRTLSLILCAVMLLSNSPMNAIPEWLSGLIIAVHATETVSGNCGADEDSVVWTLDLLSGILTISGSGKMIEYQGTSAHVAPWYTYRQSIYTVFINGGVTNICAPAFQGCINLKSVIIGGSVATIGDYAFCDCHSLTNITIPNSVISIGAMAFYNCYGLAGVTIGNSVTSIGENAFYECTSLKSIIIPNSVKTIGIAAFRSCSSITSLTIGKNVTSIGVAAFEFCHSLPSVTIPDSVTTIGDYAFADCTSLTSITVDPNNAHYCSDSNGILYDKNKTRLIQYPIGNSRKEYEVSDGVMSIGVSAFEGSTNLVSITIANSVTSIEDYSFRDCRGLTNLTIPNKVTSIGDYAFLRCANIGSVTIECGLNTIGHYAFCACTSLTNITIPSSVTSIGGYVFYGCTNLAQIYVNESNTAYSSDENGVLYDKEKKQLLQYPIGNARTSFTVPDSVTSIASVAFDYCTNLVNVFFPDSVTSIDTDFWNCTNLVYVHIPTSATISIRAFGKCPSFTYICSDTSDCYAKTYAEENGIEFRLCDGNHLQAEPELKVQVDYDEDTFDMPVTLVAEPQERASDIWQRYEFDISLRNSDEQLQAVYLICMVDENGNVVQPKEGHTVILRIPIPNGFTPELCRIAHLLDENGTSESFRIDPGDRAKPLTVSEDGRFFIIEVTCFSPFIVFSREINPTVSIRNNPGSATLQYGETLVQTADAENLPDGAKLVWKADSDRVALNPSADGKTCEITSKKNGTVTVTVKIVDANGNSIKNDGEEIAAHETIRSKAGLFYKLIWFFKRLFGIQIRTVQAVFKP